MPIPVHKNTAFPPEVPRKLCFGANRDERSLWRTCSRRSRNKVCLRCRSYRRILSLGTRLNREEHDWWAEMKGRRSNQYSGILKWKRKRITHYLFNCNLIHKCTFVLFICFAFLIIKDLSNFWLNYAYGLHTGRPYILFAISLLIIIASIDLIF